MIHIYPNKKHSLSIILHSTFKKSVQNFKKIRIVYGLKEVTVTPKFSDSIPENKCSLSSDAINTLDIPINLPYEIQFVDSKLIIGPFIGILAAVSNEKLHQTLPFLSIFVHHYEKIRGTIIAFSLEGIDQEKSIITGLIFNPISRMWIEGTFSYPRSVISIVETSLTENWSVYVKTMDHFHDLLGKRIFNYPNFDKWQMHQLLKQSLHEYLPKTVIYSEPKDVRNMLRKYSSIYIKPINGRLGKYVLMVTRIPSGVLVRFGHDSKSAKHFKSWRNFRNFLRKLLKKDSYLIQQAINLVTVENKIIDFRVIVVKNKHAIWENIGVFARYGMKNSIVSNITAGGQAEIGSRTLKTVFNLTKTERKDLILRIYQLIKTAITVLENHGYHLGNLGFDIGIDKNGKIWLIEINNQNPDHFIAVKANKKKLFYQAKLNNILYAKALSMS